MKKKTTVRPGMYVRLNQRTGEVKASAPVEPAMTVCRRIEDFPGGIAPNGALIARCVRCQARIAYEPLAPHQNVPKVCFQCVRFTPLPLES